MAARRCAVLDRLALDRHALFHCRARRAEKGNVTDIAHPPVGRRGLVVDFVIDCAARCLCCFVRCRDHDQPVAPANYRGRGGGRVTSPCRT